METKKITQREDGVEVFIPFSNALDGAMATDVVQDTESDAIENWEEKAEEVDAPETREDITGDELADYFMAEFLRGDGEGDGDDEPRLGRGVTLDKEQTPDGEDYSIGRWVALPNARMSGKVRQIVGHATSDCGFMTYWLMSPELEHSNHFKTVGMKLNGHKSFSTKEEAEKYLQKSEGESRKKILQIVTKDSLTDYNIFDPERFAMNSFEWGAIYWINQIRDEVAVYYEDGYVIPDEQFIEMLRPLKKAAKVYAEAHGKNKAWVKDTVLSVPKAFANAFDTLSDGEGVSKEHFLKVLTVEGVCALAEGSIDSVHELEDYYYRKGIYSPKGGYEVGRFVVIIKDPPSPKYESERIRHIIAIRGEKGDDDPTLVFWNTSKSGIIERKASQCSKPFHKCDDAYDWWFVENGDGARPLKKAPVPEKDGWLSAAIDILKLGGDMNAIAADAIENVFGIGQDALDLNDPDFWEKHDRAHHGGHFDPETQSCKLRETAKAAESTREKQDEQIDDISNASPDVTAIKKPEETENSRGISRIFTGSASDYAKPSLLHVGSGEGTQVYGHGLYGSSLRNDAEYYAAKAQGNFVPKPGARGNQVIYEQTFFTNRQAGDESHLLSWYDPVSEENKQRIDKALEEVSGNKMDWSDVHSGEDLYRKLANFASPQEASEFLAHNADIDGIKYPAEDHHGRQVGNNKGWDYVSFRDDNIRIDRKYVDGQKVYDYQELMARKLPGVDAMSILQRISKMDSPDAMAAEFRRILDSGKIDEKSNKSLNRDRNPLSSVVKMAMGQDSAEHRMVEFRELMAKKFPDTDVSAIISELGNIRSAEEQESYIRRILKGG